MTKSLERLKRLAKREGIKEKVIFFPDANPVEGRYALEDSIGWIALGKSAQAARVTLRQMKKEV